MNDPRKSYERSKKILGKTKNIQLKSKVNRGKLKNMYDSDTRERVYVATGVVVFWWPWWWLSIS